MTDRLCYVVAGLALMFALGLQAGRTEPAAMPTCTEDAVLVGVGSFDHGSWDAYECGSAVDDYHDFEDGNR